MNTENILFWVLLALFLLLLIAFFKKSVPPTTSAQSISKDAMFIAIILLMGLVPQLGYIQVFPWLSLTLMHLPVLLGAYLYGWKKGLLYGLAFGLTSWFVALTRASGALDVLFVYPWISVLPRLFFGFISGLLFQLVKKTPKIYRNGWAVGGLAALLSCLHTVLVFSDLYLFYPRLIQSYFSSGEPISQGIAITFLAALSLGMIGEASLAALIVPVSAKALRKVGAK